MPVSHSPKFTDDFERQLAAQAAAQGGTKDGYTFSDAFHLCKDALTTVVRVVQRLRAIAQSRKVGFNVA
ncbi:MULTISPECIES: hypothetical protein [unclassified Variovorax]|uniref:hypothetical protein n=1 Tax=unclassified Variovorax TaxID=663243 RepID=UPI00076CFA12|nr:MULTISPECIES: hypothetical protein [unclassified Variovorax]KWT95555.1 hypothetical protein APY03_2432 [Variovorax sp. WDL1]PNG50162.1 hypothetical protein CHC06_05785 [Variovorax sp. B2]PNG51035.1 hypothetical protein CHC07_05691 [Variovorax sp. B4]VTU42148.1 hypothetical protein SRS16P1_00202 [Variovorax sp. SRS16]VTU42180.1 hypothetical protein E5P1_00200 [Variovorax sp. PBL-E5]